MKHIIGFGMYFRYKLNKKNPKIKLQESETGLEFQLTFPSYPALVCTEMMKEDSLCP